jgi:competence protein ComFC
LAQESFSASAHAASAHAASANTFAIDEVRALSAYEGVIKNLIHSYKFASVKDVGEILARMIYYSLTIPDVQLIVPVPLHPKRLLERGFNQAQLIAKHLSQLSGIPTLQLLKRKKHTAPQASIDDRDLRISRLSDVFELNQEELNQDPSQFLPSKLLLIDDVATTFATLNECAKVLKNAGVEKVSGLVVAHGG